MAPTIVTETEVDVDFEVYCRECGAGMCSRTIVDGSDVHVYPCNGCLTASYENGESDGYDAGQKAAEGEIEELKDELNDALATIARLTQPPLLLEPDDYAPATIY